MISTLDKVVGVVLMDYTDYVARISLLLNDTSKFVQLSPVEKYNGTTSIQTIFQNTILRWVKCGVLCPEITEEIRHSGSI